VRGRSGKAEADRDAPGAAKGILIAALAIPAAYRGWVEAEVAT
jgi:hypothetical protein